jgi:hypothetical protein
MSALGPVSKSVGDLALATTALTYASWSVVLTDGAAWVKIAEVGGFVLLLLRVWLVLLQLKRERRPPRE